MGAQLWERVSARPGWWVCWVCWVCSLALLAGARLISACRFVIGHAIVLIDLTRSYSILLILLLRTCFYVQNLDRFQHDLTASPPIEITTGNWFRGTEIIRRSPGMDSTAIRSLLCHT